MTEPASSMTLAVFASGGGSNFQSIIQAVNAGRLECDIRLCVSNRESAGALTRAAANGIATAVLDPASFESEAAYSKALAAVLTENGIDFIALAGYLRKIPAPIVRQFEGRMVNIHPSVLPAHGGPGMYGIRVHRAVLEAGDAFSGATVQFVSEDYDAGASILQDTVPVLPGDTPEALASRVLSVEHRLYPAALSLLSQGRVRITRGRVQIAQNTPVLT